MNELIYWADNKNSTQRKKQWAVNCEIHKEQEKKHLIDKELNN